ncbi:unnamed protein product [Pedinophyceae sp. YPF-701]|nr:unnamed protein product [Pedinophyceae sp. YPF-701]
MAVETGVWAGIAVTGVAAAHVVVVRASREFTSERGSWMLRRGWWGQLVDLTDGQWAAFRASIPLLAAGLSVIVLITSLTRRLAPSAASFVSTALGLAFLWVAHGGYSVAHLCIALALYAWTTGCSGTRFFVPVTWAAACAVLAAVRLYHGFAWRDVHPALSALDAAGAGSMRWDVCFNFTMLRLISFAIDRHRAVVTKNGSAAARDVASSVGEPLPLVQYGLLPFLEYVYYAPLYITGPVMTFDAFTAARRAARRGGTTTSMPTVRTTAVYGVRVALLLVLVELFTSHLYTNLLAQRSGGWWVYQRPAVVGSLGFTSLVYLWLKFTAIWRFFRFFALADGVPAPENQRRCICDNFTVQGFWRNWHYSFYTWLLRYVYTPLGGSRWRAANSFVIFAFVAFWHDLDWELLSRLLTWAGLMAAFLLPEQVLLRAMGLAPSKGASGDVVVAGTLRRSIVSVVGTVLICGLITGCLAGFVIGGSGVVPFLTSLFSSEGWAFLGCSAVTLFAGVQLMLSIRQWEDDNGRRLCPA